MTINQQYNLCFFFFVNSWNGEETTFLTRNVFYLLLLGLEFCEILKLRLLLVFVCFFDSFSFFLSYFDF